MENIAIWILGAAQTIAISLAGFYLQRQQKKRDAKTEGRAEIRKQESLLSLRVNMAAAKMAEATAIAVKNGHANGEVSAALENLEIVKKEYFEFMNRQATEHILEK